MQENKKKILSGIQPTGVFTLGNYIGAIRNWQILQDEYDCLYMIANMHAITVKQNPTDLRAKTREAAALLLACGIDPEKSLIFVQSHVPAHAELSWVLGCSTQFGELSRMTQFKDKSGTHPENINSGLFTYPVLMAADILVYNADLVPVGADQRQHLELARNIAVRFNNSYSETFTVPDGYFPKQGARIMSLQEPEKKMSKSDTNSNSYILLLDDPDTILRKCKRAVTDADTQVCYRDDKPGINNLMGIYSVLTAKNYDEIQKEFEGKGYGDFKTAVAESIISEFRPIQNKFKSFLDDKTYMDDILKNGCEKAARLANRMVQKVYKKVGFLQL